ncbi:MAG TPA: hydroxymethylbilane synthase [Desulfotignum sp.]|jgi:hydroxymethylbilane synthase|nr:hydroxymethylbilane synthase [Desulfotignum sp.]
MTREIRIGTRGSQLALWQADHVKTLITSAFPDTVVTITVIKTTGDRITDRPLAQVGGKGLFVKEIETALLASEIHLAVHSMKDMPGELPSGLTIGAVPCRENPFDVLISRQGLALADYPSGARVGTSSLRRASQLRHLRPDLEIVSIRGNLDTRLRKLADKEYDAIVLAAAGLHRLGLADKITQYLDVAAMVPAVGQGALCIETRKDDPQTARIMERLDHGPTRACVMGERAFLKQIEGSCHIPVACYGEITADQVHLIALVASENGRHLVRENVTAPIHRIEDRGRDLARTVLEKGGRQILEAIEPHGG